MGVILASSELRDWARGGETLFMARQSVMVLHNRYLGSQQAVMFELEISKSTVIMVKYGMGREGLEIVYRLDSGDHG